MGDEAQDPGDTRPSKLTVAAGFLHMLKARSICKRAHVAAIVTDVGFTAIHAMGYNGPARGEPHDTCRNEPGNCGCVHAEANALVKLQTPERGLILISTTAPCELCARLIVNTGRIQGLVYMEDYRSTFGLAILRKAKIETGRLVVNEQHSQDRAIARQFSWPEHEYLETT